MMILECMIQESCPHTETTKVGTNAYKERISCRLCKKLLETKDKKNVADKEKEKSLDNEAYQQFLRFQEFQRQQAQQHSAKPKEKPAAKKTTSKSSSSSHP